MHLGKTVLITKYTQSGNGLLSSLQLYEAADEGGGPYEGRSPSQPCTYIIIFIVVICFANTGASEALNLCVVRGKSTSYLDLKCTKIFENKTSPVLTTALSTTLSIFTVP